MLLIADVNINLYLLFNTFCKFCYGFLLIKVSFPSLIVEVVLRDLDLEDGIIVALIWALKSAYMASLFFCISISVEKKQLYVGKGSQKTEIASIRRFLKELKLGRVERFYNPWASYSAVWYYCEDSWQIYRPINNALAYTGLN